MNTNVADFESKAKLKQRAARIGAKMDTIRASLKSVREDWFDVAEDILGARMDLPNNADFGRWWNAQEWAEEIGPDNRAACITLALNRERCLRLLAYCKRTSPETMLEFVTAIIKEEGSEPLREWRDESSEASEDCQQSAVQPPAPQNPALEAPKEVISPEPTCEKSTPDDNGVPPQAVVSDKNAAIVRWGEIGAEILMSFSYPNTRTVWNQLAGKRHGIEVAKFALAYFERASVPIPTNAAITKPNARLVLPWLNSPFADEYDLGKAAGFEKLKAELEMIERVCRPFFETRKYDKTNECFLQVRRECNRPAEEARQVEVKALRERERTVVNVQNHPPIVVYGVKLWPDGHLPENLRLSYDAARWAYRVWFDHETMFTRAEPKVSERAAVWRSSQRSLQDLTFPVGDALSYFWWRAGTAMRDHPEAHMKSFCQPSIRVK